MSARANPCRCKSQEIQLFLVFSFDYDKRLLTLRAIDRTRERASDHVKMVQEEARMFNRRIRAWIDESMSDHAFGASLYEFQGKIGT